MAGQDRRHNSHKMSKKRQMKAHKSIYQRFMKALGIKDLLDEAVSVPREKFNRSKHSPHQGQGERDRRRKQMTSGTLNYENGRRTNDCIVGNKIFETPQAAQFYLEADHV